MTPEEWSRVRPILESALEVEPANRADFLNEACADVALRREVESLIMAHEQAGTDVLSANSPAFHPGDEAKFRLEPGKRIGAYEILEEIGVGGMGAVYRAIRADGQYQQQVALKIVRPELGAEFTTNRFKNERQILASLNHPNIARILDGGATAEGLPYFVMELVEGQRIDEYCQTKKLSVSERLNLFLQICSAVGYAHQHLIIHRDIKPGNILVTAEGVPKLLDFGIAKILESSDPAIQPQQTISLVRLLTPEYASPEQVKGESITTASDVYSLGVVLYELLTGRTPYSGPTHTPHELFREVCETEPEKPSTAVRHQHTPGHRVHRNSTPEETSAGMREFSAEKLSKVLRGDLDNIVLMALRKEPARRYASVDQFAQDLQRHLQHLPVSARKDTAAYRSSKFIRRHKVGVAAAAAFTLVLLATLGLTFRQARIAQRRFNDVRQLANSLIFEVHDSIKDLPGSTPARKIIVDRALQYLSSLAQESGGDPSLQRELASAYERVGLVQGHYLQNSLGDTQGSLLSYQKALELREKVAARSSDWNDRLALAQGHRLLANQQWATGDNRSARENVSAAKRISEALNVTRPNDPQVLYELGFDYEVAGDIGYPDDAGQVKSKEDYRNAVSVDEAVIRIKPGDLRSLHGYATDLSNVGTTLQHSDPQGALSYYQRELEIEQDLHQRSPDIIYGRGVALAYGHLARQYEIMNDYHRALENDQRDLAIYQDLIRLDPQNTMLQRGLAIQYINTATQMGRTDQLPASLTYMNKGTEIMQALVASSPQNVQQRRILGQVYSARASNLLSLHQPQAAFKDLQQACAIQESFRKADPADTGAAISAAACTKQMGIAAAQSGETQSAAKYFHDALAVVEPALSEPAPNLEALYAAADAYAGLGDLQVKEARSPGQNDAHRKAMWTGARASYQKSLEIWHRVAHPEHSSPDGLDVTDPAEVLKRLQICDAALSKSVRSRFPTDSVK
jgi:eukaryotic-like serine/threonine-protein kinase